MLEIARIGFWDKTPNQSGSERIGQSFRYVWSVESLALLTKNYDANISAKIKRIYEKILVFPASLLDK